MQLINFPDSRTNTFQSISTIKNFIEKKYEVELVYQIEKKRRMILKNFMKLKMNLKLQKLNIQKI